MHIETGHPVSGDVKRVDANAVRFIAEDGRCMFEVRVESETRIEVRGVDTCRVNGVILDCLLILHPRHGNSIMVSTTPWVGDK